MRTPPTSKAWEVQPTWWPRYFAFFFPTGVGGAEGLWVGDVWRVRRRMKGDEGEIYRDALPIPLLNHDFPTCCLAFVPDQASNVVFSRFASNTAWWKWSEGGALWLRVSGLHRCWQAGARSGPCMPLGAACMSAVWQAEARIGAGQPEHAQSLYQPCAFPPPCRPAVASSACTLNVACVQPSHLRHDTACVMPCQCPPNATTIADQRRPHPPAQHRVCIQHGHARGWRRLCVQQRHGGRAGRQ